MRQKTFRWLCDRPSIQWCFKTVFFEPIASTPPTLVANGATPYQHWGCPSCRQRNHTLPKLFFAKNNHLSPGHAQSLVKKQHMMLETLAGIVCFAQVLTFFSTPPIGMFWDSTSNSAFFYTGKVIFFHLNFHFCTANVIFSLEMRGFAIIQRHFHVATAQRTRGAKMRARAMSIHGVPRPEIFHTHLVVRFGTPSEVGGGSPPHSPFL